MTVIGFKGFIAHEGGGEELGFGCIPLLFGFFCYDVINICFGFLLSVHNHNSNMITY